MLISKNKNSTYFLKEAALRFSITNVKLLYSFIADDFVKLATNTKGVITVRSLKLLTLKLKALMSRLKTNDEVTKKIIDSIYLNTDTLIQD